MAEHFLPQQNFPLLRRLMIGLTAFLVLLLLWSFWKSQDTSSADDRWQFIVCDVGQGSAALIRTGDSSALVVDTGEKDDALTACLDWVGVDVVEGVFLSHNHADHTGGFDGAVEKAPEDRPLAVFCSVGLGERCSVGSSEDLRESNRIKPTVLKAGNQFSFARGSISVIGPVAESQAENPNDDSLVLSVSLKQGAGNNSTQHFEVLLPGDAEVNALNTALAASPQTLIETDLLVLAHHGSKTSGTDYIQRSNAQIAAVSAGKGNSYGHPHQEVLHAVETKHINLVSTADEGHLAFFVENNMLTVNTETAQ